MEFESMWGVMFTLTCGAALFLPASIGLALLQARKPEAGGQTGIARLGILLVLPILLGFVVAFAMTRIICGAGMCIDQYDQGYYGLIPACGASFALAFALTAFTGYWLARMASWNLALLAPVLLGASVLVLGILLYAGRVFDPARWELEKEVATRASRAKNFDCGAIDGIPVEECEALVAFYRQTDGAEWSSRVEKGEWLASQTPCRWYGLSCSGGHVDRLVMHGDDYSPGGHGYSYGAPDLAGSLPRELADLTQLQELNLSGNRLTGQIPPELGDLANLKTLILGGNELAGTIPPELGDLANLEILSLGVIGTVGGRGNRISGTIPTDLGRLAHLKTLDLSHNQLSGTIPSELGKLAELQVMDLGSNQLSGEIPGELGNLSVLQELRLGYNLLTGSIPQELSGLTRLQELNLSDNRLSGGIPGALGSLKTLLRLYLGNNLLTGSIPQEFSGLTGLHMLALDHNQLSGEIPGGLGNLAALEGLYLDHNLLSGSIPEEFSRLAWFDRLSLDDNKLSGPLPRFLVNTELESFTFSDTGLCEPGDAEFQKWLARSRPELSLASGTPAPGATLSQETLRRLGQTGVICPE
jgi:Leucine-rich repeat (LRR) protein